LADQALIDLVKDNLPSWRVDVTPDWTDQKISDELDKHGGSWAKVIRQYWLQRVNDVAGLTDISDVGATRPLSQLYQHAQEMLRYWDRIAGEGVSASTNGKIKKRYERVGAAPPYGLNPYGGVYARSD
jgi:hypothetical protein